MTKSLPGGRCSGGGNKSEGHFPAGRRATTGVVPDSHSLANL